MYELCLGAETFTSLLDRITTRACAVTPGLVAERCRELVALAFRVRVHKTEACGHHPACVPVRALWRERPVPSAGDMSGWQDRDPEGLPAMLAVALADLAGTPDWARPAIVLRLRAELQEILSERLFANPRCGRAAICRGE